MKNLYIGVLLSAAFIASFYSLVGAGLCLLMAYILYSSKGSFYSGSADGSSDSSSSDSTDCGGDGGGDGGCD